MNWKKIKEEHVGQKMLVYAAHGEMAVGCVEKNKGGEFFAVLFTKGSPTVKHLTHVMELPADPLYWMPRQNEPKGELYPHRSGVDEKGKIYYYVPTLLQWDNGEEVLN